MQCFIPAGVRQRADRVQGGSLQRLLPDREGRQDGATDAFGGTQARQDSQGLLVRENDLTFVGSSSFPAPITSRYVQKLSFY